MSNPKHTLFWMTLFLAVVVLVGALIHKPLIAAFMANWVFNLLILCVLIVGIAMTYRQVMILFPELRWISQFRTGHSGLSVLQEPRLLKPLARQLGEESKRDRFKLSTLSLRTVLDGIHSRMDEQREITRYFISLLIFLGLLGTFWGLLGTINSVGDVITNLNMSEEDFGKVFGELQAGLQTPLQGMGTAFSSSLLGLGGSLILGFLDIQAGHAQNRFYDGLEEWLTGVTNLVDIVDEESPRS
ncbi:MULTISPECIES: MotA/TolQ/ExbB proton channel family protein [Marinobacter]|uniref:MotA/TolQ/ExbB proton channel family protein n=1 Tax=Marinobacter suaedae TaxID=3057675 RepID=A0ABT8W026_9GAMM|nr:MULTISPECIES: MotA/TolQ/ExbB proton channel family protein [unclassified Marinobacter]MBZ2169769.1 MotA/TolQ/ExbB proton channel family protein [Marinobacter sp. F4216]MDO3721592.1 MotA/TolQ/ExbB proton channel family protein [Marinobacter sp. chi1]